MSMREAIAEELRAVERERGVRVLFAVESGSRAWGIASPDSDYDVRFVYARPVEGYLRLEKVRDTIEWRLDSTLDVVGWDLCKLLRLMRGSNPTVFEWLASPIVYRESPALDRIRECATACFSPKASAHHYLGMATGEEKAYSRGERASAKSYLYAIRALLSARWVLDWNLPAPMRFSELVEEVLEAELVPLVEGLLESKSSGRERCEVARIRDLEEWLVRERELLFDRARAVEGPVKVNWAVLDELFRSLVRG